MIASHVHVERMLGVALLLADLAEENAARVARLNVVDHAALVAVGEPALRALVGLGAQANHLALQRLLVI